MASDSIGIGDKVNKRALSSTIMALFSILWIAACTTTGPDPTELVRWLCRSPPEGFKESDLVGTWQATYTAAGTTEELILRVDKTFRQLYQRSDGYHYESPWRQWWIEHKPSGGIYVHLEGMRYCRLTAEVCAMPGGGGGEWLFHDVCEDRLIRMRNEVVLAVVGTTGSRHPGVVGAPKGIALMHMLPSSDTTTSYFVLENE